jgi:hypothetical protein
MNHEDLIQKAITGAKANGITEQLVNPRVREAAVIYFDTRKPDGSYEVIVDLHSGAFISATLSHSGLSDT